MNKSFLLFFILAKSAMAGLPPTTVQGQYDASSQTKFNFQVPYNQKTDLGGVKSLFETGNKNLLTNASFENTTFDTGWTVTTITDAAETTNIVDGKKSAKLTYSAQTGGISQSVTPTIQTNGVNYEASCRVNTTMTKIEVCGLAGGNKQNCQSVPSTGTWQNVTASFGGPSNGTSVGVQIDVTSSDTGTAYVDDCYVGPARNSGMATFTTPPTAYTITITATGSNPTPGTTSINSAQWSRVGRYMLINYQYKQTGAGISGSGTYLFNIPTGYTIDSSVITASTSDPIASLGSGYASFGGVSTGAVLTPVAYDSTHLMLVNSGASFVASNSYNLANVTLVYSFEVLIPITQFSDTSFYRADTTPANYSGYQTVAGGCSTASSTYADVAACTTITLNQQYNRNFGTVSTAGSSLPGITFTPPRTGNYLVCASGTVSTSLASAISVRMTDGTNVLNNGQTSSVITSGDGPFSLCGTESVSSISALTVKLQLATTAGTASIVNGTASGSSAIQWNVVELDAPMPAPYLTGSLTSTNSSNGYRLEEANITCSGSSAINNQSPSAAWTINNISSGKCTVTIPSTQFSSTNYNCSVMSNGTSVTSIEQYRINNKTATGFDIYGASVSNGSSTIGALTSYTIDLICMGPI